ncbi:hypothetical protein EhV18_00453 [Emiliania huxleyi virus 18]|nr:hypothetical protein EhV18_00453 [Emiliania huxleyi virus 18]AHA55539.1 hypothetical protein EhV156_00444 [Emiliania huxleyi virus 156]
MCGPQNVQFMNNHINYKTVAITKLPGTSYKHHLRYYGIHDALESNKNCSHIIFSDASDVIPQNFNSSDVLVAFNKVANDVYSFIAGTESACWIGKPCTRKRILEMKQTRPSFFKQTCKTTGYRQPCFLNTMWMSTYKAAALYINYALRFITKYASRSGMLDDQAILHDFVLKNNYTVADYHENIFASFKRLYVTANTNYSCKCDSKPKMFYNSDGKFCYNQNVSAYSIENNILTYNPTMSRPKVLWHGNGKVSKHILNDIKKYYI